MICVKAWPLLILFAIVVSLMPTVDTHAGHWRTTNDNKVSTLHVCSGGAELRFVAIPEHFDSTFPPPTGPFYSYHNAIGYLPDLTAPFKWGIPGEPLPLDRLVLDAAPIQLPLLASPVGIDADEDGAVDSYFWYDGTQYLGSILNG